MTVKTAILGTACALALAAPAAAQDYCGGEVGTGAWIGGSQNASDIARADAFREQLALVLMGNAHVSLFELTEPAEVRLEAEARGAGDPLIEVLGPSGEIVGADDDSGGGTAAAALLPLEPGIYCLRTESYDNAPLTATVRIGRSEHEALTEGGANVPPAGAPATDAAAPPETADEAAQTAATGPCEGAAALGPDPADPALAEGVTGTAPVGATASWRFTLGAPAQVSLRAENEEADPVLTLSHPSGEIIAENDDFDGLNSRIDLAQPLEAGTYCIGLQALSDPEAPVTVTLSAYDPEQATRALYDRGEIAPPLDGSYPVRDLGPVDGRLVADAQMAPGTATWFSLQVQEAGLLLVEAIATASGDPTLTLFDDVGREIAFNDDYGQNYDSQIAARVFPGTYLVALTDLSDTGPLLRLVAERFVSAR